MQLCSRHSFKIGSVTRLHCMQGMWQFERSREKRYITACELSVTRLLHERYLLHRWYEILVRACRHDEAPSTERHKKVECCASAVVPVIPVAVEFIGFNSRYFSGIGIKVIKSYV